LNVDGRIQVCPDNAHYFAYRGRPIFLCGNTISGGWTAINDTRFDIERDITLLADANGNYTRITSYKPGFDLNPWLKKGKKFNLETTNPEWQDRLRLYLEICLNHDVIVQLDVWENWSLVHDETDHRRAVNWLANAFHPDNNVNYGTEVLERDTNRIAPPFYDSIPERKNRLELLRYQTRFIEGMLEVTTPFPNVLYNLGNETCAPFEWAKYWAKHIKRYCSERGYKVLVGDMPNNDDSATPIMTYLLDEIFDFADASQVTSHHAADGSGIAAIAGVTNALLHEWHRNQAYYKPKPVTVSKIYCRDRIALWSKFMSGGASARYHRPGSEAFPHAASDKAGFRDIANLRKFIDTVSFAEMRPVAAGRIDGRVETRIKVIGDFNIHLMASEARDVSVLYLIDPKNAGNKGGGISYFVGSGSYKVSYYDTVTGVFIREENELILEGETHLLLDIPPFERDLALVVRRLED